MKSVKYLKELLGDKTKQYPDHLKLRTLSWPVLSLICDLPISANIVTILSLLTTLFGGLLISFLWGYWRLLGVAVMYLGVVLDFVDGGVARYKNQSSRGGQFLDSLGHSFIPALILALIGFAATISTYNVIYTILGIIAGLFFLATIDFSFKREKFGKGQEQHIQKEEGWRRLLGIPTYYLIELIGLSIIINKIEWLAIMYFIYIPLRCLAFGYVCFKSLERIKE